MEKITPKEIEKALKSHDVSPSPEWRERVLLSIRSLEGDKLFFNNFFMKKLFAGVFMVAVVALTSVYVYTTNTPYAKAMTHLENASVALEQLKNPGANSVGFLPTAYAEADSGSETVGLIDEVINETDEAVNLSDEIEDSDDLDEVLDAVDVVQDDTVDVLSDVIAETDDVAVLTAAVEAVDETDASNEVVEDVLVSDDDAVKENLKEKVNTKRQEKRAMKLVTAQELMVGLDVEYANMTDSMKAKYDTIKQILADCDSLVTNPSEELKCNSGKAAGLAKALSVKVNNEARHEEKKMKKEDEKLEKETEKVEKKAEKLDEKAEKDAEKLNEKEEKEAEKLDEKAKKDAEELGEKAEKDKEKSEELNENDNEDEGDEDENEED